MYCWKECDKMQKNAFEKVSSLSVIATRKDGKTILQDVRFTAPYKIMQPFIQKDGGIQIMLLSASAGIMEGDCQDFKFKICTGAQLEFVSQSYDKIHQMKEGCAVRNTVIDVESGGTFFFHPQATIPFRDSGFENKIQVFLEDETSDFWMSEILCSGRYGMGESFAYRFYNNMVEIRRDSNLIYRDNTRYDPKLFPMNDIGMYEGFTHLLNIFATRPKNPEAFISEVQELLADESEIEGGLTRLGKGDFCVRIFGYRAQKLEEKSQQIKQIWKKQNKK